MRNAKVKQTNHSLKIENQIRSTIFVGIIKHLGFKITNNMKKLLFLFLLPILACNNKIAKETRVKPLSFDNKKEMSTIALGSCNDQARSQEIWQYIVANQPELWVWLGDNIYADTEDMKVMADKYNQQKSNQGYQSLIKTCPIIGIWDDHDYGINDAGIEYAKKIESKKLMLDFLDVPKNADVRKKRDAAYQSFVYGPEGKQVKVILLDARYYRDALTKDDREGRRYQASEEGTGNVLGEEQWQWLEKELMESTAQVHLIGSGIQFIPEDHGWEKWANFPIERKRFFDLLAKTKPKNPVLMSGDRHIAELSKIQIKGLDYPVYEITSSGLTHVWGVRRPELNQHRVGEIVYDRNFALLHIDWTKKNPELTVEVKGLKNESFLKKTLEY